MWSTVYTPGSMSRLLRSIESVSLRRAGEFGVSGGERVGTVVIDRDAGKLRWMRPGPRDDAVGRALSAAVGPGIRVVFSAFEDVYEANDVNVRKPSPRDCLLDMPYEVLTDDERRVLACGSLDEPPSRIIDAIAAATCLGWVSDVLELRLRVSDEDAHRAVAGSRAGAENVKAAVLALLQAGCLPTERQAASFVDAETIEAYETLKEWGWV